MLHTVQSQVERVELLAEQAATIPTARPVRSRKAYQWLRFLSAPVNLETHLASLAAAHQFIQEISDQQPSAVRHGMIFQLELYHTTALYRANPEKLRPRTVFNEGFAGAPPEVLKALTFITIGVGTEADVAFVKNYANSEDYTEIVQTLEFTSSAAQNFTPGRHYDLAEIFKNINANYFWGRMPRPQLTWNNTLTTRKFGHYHPASDTVMISITLDDPRCRTT